MIIKYYIDRVYGIERAYIVDEGIKQAVYKLTGKETITPLNKKGLEALGFEFEQVLKV